MTTHFRSGPAFGLSAEVKIKVPHSINAVVKKDCQELTINANLLRLFKINLNHIRFRFFTILLGRRNYPHIKKSLTCKTIFKNPILY